MSIFKLLLGLSISFFVFLILLGKLINFLLCLLFIFLGEILLLLVDCLKLLLLFEEVLEFLLDAVPVFLARHENTVNLLDLLLFLFDRFLFEGDLLLGTFEL